ncbi:MAG: hypothetical protein IJ093_03055 [Bacilli bacterium]|nr:hypothetical protein [Bacilli bacterium]
MNQKEILKEALGEISENCAYIKFNGDEIEYIRIDDHIFRDPKSMGDDIIEYTKKIHEAVDKVMEYSDCTEYGPHIDPLITKYHPCWIGLREFNKFVKVKEGEEPCIKPHTYKTYDQWIHAEHLAAGMNPIYVPKLARDSIISREVFESVIENATANLDPNEPILVHPDLLAFNETVKLKKYIDSYHRKRKTIENKKDLEYNFKDVSYRLSRAGFPLIIVGTNNKRREYDIRESSQRDKLYMRLGDKNPNTEFSDIAKTLRKNR